MTTTIIHLAALLAAAALFAAAAVTDVRSYRIPNALCAALLLLFPVFAATAPHSVAWYQNIAVFTLVSAAGFAAFWRGLVGAGDVKLLSVASLWAGPSFIAVLLFVMALAGGLESLVVGAALYAKRSKGGKAAQFAKAQIPYGVAIATGGVMMLGLMARPILLSD